jgi:hypothetical protein
MAAPEAAYLVSNCCLGSTLVPVFAEVVSPSDCRENQWTRVTAAQAQRRLCRIFASKNDYRAWLEMITEPGA